MDRTSKVLNTPIRLKAKSHVHVAEKKHYAVVVYASALQVGDWFGYSGGAYCVVRAYAGYLCCKIYSGTFWHACIRFEPTTNTTC